LSWSAPLNKIVFFAASIIAGVLLGATIYTLLPGVAGWSVVRESTASAVSDSAASSKPANVNTSTESPRPHQSRDSYHDGIMRVAPSVVSLYSSETIHRAPPKRLADGSISPSIAPRERQSTSQGSGVIVSSDGIVLTNYHLVADADDINVVLSDGSLHQAELIGSDRETDLAVVRIDADGLPAVPIEGAPPIRVGDIVLAIGNPFGVGQTVTQGIVSATRRRVAGGSAWQNFVQIDAAINPGNSGGALINPDGHLVGVNTAVFLRENNAEGIGFAIPAELLAQVVPQIIANGRVIRAWLGIGADDLPMFPEFNRNVERGAIITGILPGSPAARGGLQAYDVVTKLGNVPIENATELLLLVSALKPDSDITLRVIRAGQARSLRVRLGERPVFDNVGPR